MARTPSTEDVYEGDGVTAVFQFHFPYLHSSDVFVSVDGVNVSFTILPGSVAQVQLTVPPPLGSVVKVYRSTLAFVPEHLFAGGVPFLPRYVDENNRQLLYSTQEAINDTAVLAASALQTAEEAKDIAQAAEDKIDGAIIDSSFQLRLDLLNPAMGTNLIMHGPAPGVNLADCIDLYPEHFGAVGDGIANDQAAVQAWANALPPNCTARGKRGSSYRIVDGFEMQVDGVTIRDTYFVYPESSATFYHGVRITAKRTRFVNNVVETPNGLVRDDTGFGVLIGAGSDDTVVANNVLLRTASAAVWVSGGTNFQITGNKVFWPLADGIHVSDNCRNGVIAGNLLQGCHDDSLAIVGDTPLQAAPLNMLVYGNIVDGSVAGHGCVLIACDTVVVKGNIFRGTGYAAVGSYFWQLSGAPVAKDWANNCVVEGNLIVAPSLNPSNVNNVAGIFGGACAGWEIRNNTIFAPASETLTAASCIRMVAYQGCLIEGNRMRDSASYGVWNPDVNVNGAVNCTGLVVRDNYFSNIAKQPVRLVTAAADIGVTHILRNDFTLCGYDAGTTYLIQVAKTLTNRLVIQGNNNLDGTKGYTYDAATCTNVWAADNSPSLAWNFTPVASPMSGSWTTAVAGTGRLLMKGKTLHGTMSYTITNKGTGVGFKFDLPTAFLQSSLPTTLFLGRENGITGRMLTAIPINATQVQVLDYNNADPVTANGTIINLTFSYDIA